MTADASATAPGAAAAPPEVPRPGPGAPRPYHFPRFERTRLENGLGVIVAPVRKLPLVTLTLVTDAGAGVEERGRDGVANLTALALLEGTAVRDGNALAEQLEGLGASISAAADWDAAVISLTVMSNRLDDALPLLGEVLLQPAFPEREVQRLKAERLAELLQLRTEPRGLADEMFARFAYEAASRYALPEDGDAASVRALGRDDLVRFYRERYRPAGSTLIVVGDVDVAEGEALARRMLGGWTGSAAPRVVPEGRGGDSARSVRIVAKPDAPQSELRVGHVGLPRSHPDYFPVVIMNAVLGGLFSSRINLNLREAHAYTYGAFSGFAWRLGAGPFVVSTAVRSDVTADAAREVLHEIDRVRAEPISESELSLATSYLDGVFPIRYETTDAIARALAGLVVYGLRDDYYDRYRENIREVSAADVLRVARAHLHPEAMQVLAVGDAAAIRGPLEALALGPVLVVDADGQPVSSS